MFSKRCRCEIQRRKSEWYTCSLCCPDALLLHHTATFQVELLLAGDVEPSPGDSEGNNSRRNSQPNGNNFNTRNIILHINSRSLIRLREEGGYPLSIPLYKPRRYVQPRRVRFLGPFGRPRTAINFAHFGLESGMVFEELRECMNVFIGSIPNE